MTTSQIFFFFITLLVLATSLTTTFSLISDHHDDHDHQDHKNQLATVHITNGLPKINSSPMNIRCSTEQTDFGVKTLGCGEDYRWIVEERGVYFCEALWGRFMASWHAFQPKRDVGQRLVFWLVQPSGFFLSWDNSSWVRKSTWETE